MELGVGAVPRAPLRLGACAAVAEVAVRALRPRGPELQPIAVKPEAYFNAARVREARAYRRGGLALGLVGTGLEAGLLAALARRPPRPPVGLGQQRPVAGGAVAGAALALGLTAAGLPLDAVGHARARRVGLATQGWRGWLADVGRGAAISAPLAAGGGALAVWTLRRWPRRWWLPAAGATVTAGTAAVLAGPVLLDPVFNRFTPLPAGPLRSEVLALGGRAGVALGSVLTVDASRRTTGVNAYVTGLGPTKRVVLYDTLLERFSREEVRLVVAHELAHVRHRDVGRGLSFITLTSPMAMLAVQGLLESRIRGPGERPHPPSAPGPDVLPALVLAIGLVSAVIAPAGNRLSRALERRADRFALDLVRTPDAFVGLERRLVEENLADPAPARWLTALLATHPPGVERIGAALAWARAQPPADAPPAFALAA